MIDHLAKVWLAVAAGGLLYRTVHLFFLKDVKTGLVWFVKILTDPFNDIKLYQGRRCSFSAGRCTTRLARTAIA